MQTGYQVKGSSIRSKLDFVRDRFGEGAADPLRSDLESGAIGPLGDASGRTILDSAWYPFELYIGLLERIAQDHFSGNLAQLVEVGRYSAEQSLRTVYKSFVRSGSFIAFLDRIASLHSLLYSEGAMQVEVTPGESACTILLSGAPSYPQADSYVAQGFYTGAAQTLGLTSVRGHFRDSGEGVSFELSWAESMERSPTG